MYTRIRSYIEHYMYMIFMFIMYYFIAYFLANQKK